MSFAEAVARAREELAREGFGSCVEPALGVLLPCNVVVYQQQGHTHIAAVDAEQMLSIVGNDELASTASEVRRRLAAVVDRVAQG